MTIISVSGKAGAGKDTLADLLVKKHRFTKISFADPLRELCCKIFDIPMNWFLDRDKKDSDMPSRIELDYKHIDKILEYVENKWGFVVNNEVRSEIDSTYGAVFSTPRDILKFIGTNLLRKYVRDDIWVVLALAKMKEIGERIVLADVRFDNERRVLENAGATLILVKRPGLESEDTHISEDTGDEEEYHVIFNNKGTLNEFHADIDMWYTLREATLARPKFKYTY